MEGVVTVTPAAATAQPGAVGRPESQDGSHYSLSPEPRPPHSLVPEAQDPLGNSCSSTGPPDPGTEDQGGGISNKTGIPSGGLAYQGSDWAEAWPGAFEDLWLWYNFVM